MFPDQLVYSEASLLKEEVIPLILGICLRCPWEPFTNLIHSFLTELVLYVDLRVTSRLCQLLTT